MWSCKWREKVVNGQLVLNHTRQWKNVSITENIIEKCGFILFHGEGK